MLLNIKSSVILLSILHVITARTTFNPFNNISSGFSSEFLNGTDSNGSYNDILKETSLLDDGYDDELGKINNNSIISSDDDYYEDLGETSTDSTTSSDDDEDEQSGETNNDPITSSNEDNDDEQGETNNDNITSSDDDNDDEQGETNNDPVTSTNGDNDDEQGETNNDPVTSTNGDNDDEQGETNNDPITSTNDDNDDEQGETNNDSITSTNGDNDDEQGETNNDSVTSTNGDNDDEQGETNNDSITSLDDDNDDEQGETNDDPITSTNDDNDDEQGETISSDDDYDDGSQCVLSAMPPMPGSECCGVDVSSTNRIIGGSPTELKQYPWLVWIERVNVTSNEFDLKCGGSLISGLYVLTAAHCVKPTKDILLTNVYLGDYNRSHTGPDCIQANGESVCTDGEVKIAIERTIMYKSYDTELGNNDIALIKLAEMVTYSESIRPICLPMLDLNMAVHRNMWLTVAGWGTSGYRPTEKKYYYKTILPDVKKHVEVPFVPLERCRIEHSVTDYQICAGGRRGENACYGDSGGPLMYNNDGVYVVVGVVSRGVIDGGCAMRNIPTVYTNVHMYYDWIMDIIQIDIYMEELTNNVSR